MITGEPTNGPRVPRALGPFFVGVDMSQKFVEIAGRGECGKDVEAAACTSAGNAAEWADAGLLVTSDKLARLLNISKRTLMRLRSVGKLPRPVQLGRLVRWRAAEVHEWVEAGCPVLAIWEPRATGTRTSRVSRYRRAR